MVVVVDAASELCCCFDVMLSLSFMVALHA